MAQTILVVDDDPAILQGLAILLRQAGYTVLCAADGARARTVLAGPHPPALVILDVVLPDISGLEICQAIRRVPGDIPVLMLSARDDAVDKVLGLELGADDYLTKPFEPRELVARVRALLRRTDRLTSPLPADTPLRFGALTLWPDAHRVDVAGQPLELPPKEWALLEVFLRHPTRVFGRETLLNQVWGIDFDGDTRTVDVHVQRLRARLDAHLAQPVIETVRGFGYRLAQGAASSTAP